MKSTKRVAGRLAPSPTGALHLGNARSFLLAWLSIRQQDGLLRLRIEDIDSPRVKPWAVDQAIEDLRWLGLDWDVEAAGPTKDARVFQQTEHIDRYLRCIELLKGNERIYPCICSRKDVALSASAPHGASPLAEKDGQQSFVPLEGDVYPRTCEGRHLDSARLAEKHCWRWRFTDETISWVDGVQGEQSANPARQLGDFVVAKFDGERLVPAYQLAVVVDDHEQGIDEVVRGDDLIYSTYRQLALWNHFGWTPPKYYHVPLVVGPDGRRLAKRHGDTRLSEFRKLGIKAEAVIGYLAYTLGLTEKLGPVACGDLVGSLKWDDLPKEPTVFDLQQDLPKLTRLSKQS